MGFLDFFKREKSIEIQIAVNLKYKTFDEKIFFKEFFTELRPYIGEESFDFLISSDFESKMYTSKYPKKITKEQLKKAGIKRLETEEDYLDLTEEQENKLGVVKKEEKKGHIRHIYFTFPIDEKNLQDILNVASNFYYSKKYKGKVTIEVSKITHKSKSYLIK